MFYVLLCDSAFLLDLRACDDCRPATRDCKRKLPGKRGATPGKHHGGLGWSFCVYAGLLGVCPC